jgi:hypothetical protein
VASADELAPGDYECDSASAGRASARNIILNMRDGAENSIPVEKILKGDIITA